MKKINLLTSILITVFILVQMHLYSQNAWEWENPLPQGNDLNAVKFADEDIGYAVGNTGTIIKTTDGGENWIIQNYVTDIDLLSVSVVNENTVYATGHENYGGNGTFVKTTNGGEHWIELNNPPNPSSIYFTNDSVGYIGGDYSSIYKTTDGGENWFQVNSGSTSEIKCIHFANENVGYAVGYSFGTIFKTTDAGETWTNIDDHEGWYQSVYFTSIDTGYVVGMGFDGVGEILSTFNGGADWTVQNSGVLNLRSIDFVSANTGYILCDSVLLKTTDAGGTWTNMGGYGGKSICFHEANNGYIVGSIGKIMKSTDEGANWSTQSETITHNDLLSASFPNAATGYTVGQNGTILKTIDGGDSWSEQNSGTGENLSSVGFIDENNGIAVGDEGTILKTIDGGQNWTSQPSGTLQYLRSIFFLDANIAYALGSDILKTTNGGTDWVILNFEYECVLRSVFFTSENVGFAVGDFSLPFMNPQGYIFKTSDGGSNWNVVDTVPNRKLFDVSFTSENTGYIGGDDSILLKSTDQGENWEEVVSSPFAEFFSIVDLYFIDETNGYAVMNDDNGYGHINKNKLLVTSDGFEWEVQEFPIMSQNVINSIQFTDENTGILVGDFGTILKTNTGGIPVQIDNIESVKSNVKVYPNPAVNYIKIEFPTKTESLINLSIYNLNGQQLLKKQLRATNTEIEVSNLQPGLYLVEVQTDDAIEYKKFTKK